TCTCGCKYTLAQCRIWDSACAVSKAAAEKIVASLAGAPKAPDASSPAAPPRNPAPRTASQSKRQ
ncbi:MAG: hypothetical protein ACRD51_09250, partial [Candidatus Acidiferrum sp.]